MMQAAQNWQRNNTPSGHRCCLCTLRSSGDPLLNALMRARLIKVNGILFEHTVQVLFTEDEQVIQAFTAHAPQQPLADGIRPWCFERRSEHLNPRPCRNCGKLVTVLRVIVTNEISCCFAKGCCFAQLLCGPEVCRCPRDADVHDAPRAELRNDERK